MTEVNPETIGRVGLTWTANELPRWATVQVIIADASVTLGTPDMTADDAMDLLLAGVLASSSPVYTVTGVTVRERATRPKRDPPVPPDRQPRPPVAPETRSAAPPTRPEPTL